MFKFVVLSVVALACVSAAPGGLVVPVAPAVAVAHTVPVGSSYSNTYRAPVVKALPVLHATPIVHAAQPVIATPLVAAHPIVKTSHRVIATPLVAAHPIVKTSHQVIAHPSPALIKTVPHVTPVVHSAPIVHGLGLPVTSYASHYNVQPIVKTHIAAAPVALVH